MEKSIHNILSALLLLAGTVLLLPLSSCSQNDRLENQIIQYHGREVQVSAFEPDLIRIKVSQSLADSLVCDTEGVINITSTGVRSVDRLVSSIGIKKMRRTFPPAGIFEPRTREARLHLWYNVYFDSNTTLTRASEEIESIEGIDLVEFCPKTILIGSSKGIPVEQRTLSVPSAITDTFNDPMLPDQWHYYNDGSLENSIAGSDINVLPVWNRGTTGKPEVIVAVVDGGVDYTHEDLAANMWHNPEGSGENIYGYNFVTNGPLVTAEDHGTHVAGTVAAVNNNGKGVCGIAGGDGSSSTGVRIMSCQIFQGEKSGSGAEAIKWAADHGAVIAQNSWGYQFETYQDALASATPQYDKDAMDYFTKNAGLDENGQQTGPMAGGIVIFAAGNDGWDVGYPGDYETCVAVGSIGADYRAAYYTNYGDWVDVAAPGGDVQKGRQVLSTLPKNQYGYMQGTSMACPHVSGIAALIVSENGKHGYTSTALRQALESTVRDISAYNGTKYIGKGLVDAYRAVVGSNGQPPETITEFEASVQSNNVYFSVTIPHDPDDGKPNMIFIYYSESPLTQSNYSSALFQSYVVGDLQPGDKLENVVKDLDFEKQYYMTAVATDYGGNASPISTIISVTTEANQAPVLTPIDDTHIEMKAWETGRIRFLAIDPDGHRLSASAGPDDVSLSTDFKDDTLILTIQGVTSLPGEHSAYVRIDDPYGLYDEVNVTYTVAENTPPVLIKEIDGIIFNSVQDPTVNLDMTEYFYDADGEQLAISTSTTTNNVVNLAIRQNMVNITPLGYGIVNATITAKDALGESVSTTFPIAVTNSEQPVEIYPNPVTDTLYVHTGANAEGHVRITSSSGATVFDEDVSVSIFSPAAIDMTSLPGGVYTVTVNYDNTEVKRNIVKL